MLSQSAARGRREQRRGEHSSEISKNYMYLTLTVQWVFHWKKEIMLRARSACVRVEYSMICSAIFHNDGGKNNIFIPFGAQHCLEQDHQPFAPSTCAVQKGRKCFPLSHQHISTHIFQGPSPSQAKKKPMKCLRINLLSLFASAPRKAGSERVE